MYLLKRLGYDNEGIMLMSSQENPRIQARLNRKMSNNPLRTRNQHFTKLPIDLIVQNYKYYNLNLFENIILLYSQ